MDGGREGGEEKEGGKDRRREGEGHIFHKHTRQRTTNSRAGGATAMKVIRHTALQQSSRKVMVVKSHSGHLALEPREPEQQTGIVPIS